MNRSGKSLWKALRDRHRISVQAVLELVRDAVPFEIIIRVIIRPWNWTALRPARNTPLRSFRPRYIHGFYERRCRRFAGGFAAGVPPALVLGAAALTPTRETLCGSKG